jgi:tripartite-type tricarboxylate transporter receptor subunit TctC
MRLAGALIAVLASAALASAETYPSHPVTIDLACLEASSGLAYVQAGKFKAFAVLSDRRWPKSPDTRR